MDNYLSNSEQICTGRVPNLGQCLKLGHLQLCIEKIQIFMKIYLFNKLIPIQHTLKSKACAALCDLPFFFKFIIKSGKLSIKITFICT